jgi:uncharacterized protein YcaQ
VTVHELSRSAARRIAVRAQLLTKERPCDLVETVRQLFLLQLDPTSAVAPSAELVLWSRLGSAFDPQQLRDALDEQRLIELHQTVRVPEDLALFRAEMAAWPGNGELRGWQEEVRDWVKVNNDCRRDILDRLRADGPLPTSELPDTCVVPWNSSVWNDNRNGPDDARQARAARRGRGRGRASTSATPARTRSSKGSAARAGRPGPARPALSGRAALLSPFDRLVADRKRLAELFEFDYILEMYKPAATRMWGYYALPILYGDRLVGKLDAKADLKEGELRVAAVHRDVPFTMATSAAVDRRSRTWPAGSTSSSSCPAEAGQGDATGRQDPEGERVGP